MSAPTITGNDAQRTRATDPVESHRAADRSQRNVKRSAIAVLQLVHMEGELAGSEINDLYGKRCERNGWPYVAGDSPRKRASDLCANGFLEAIGTQKGARLQERIFRITDDGKRELGVLV